MRTSQALNEAFRLGLIERSLDSASWPCDMYGASAIKIHISKNEVRQPPPPPHYGSKVTTAKLQLHEMQDFADCLYALREATADHPLRIRVTVEVGENGEVDQAVADKVNAVLSEVKSEWNTE